MACSITKKPSTITILALAVSLAAAGCGTDTKADLANGKTLFNQKCGSCHALGKAGSKGVAGPDLDAAFTQSIEEGMPRSTIQAVVRNQIQLASGKMPADIVTGDDARDVAGYVASVAAAK